MTSPRPTFGRYALYYFVYLVGAGLVVAFISYIISNNSSGNSTGTTREFMFGVVLVVAIGSALLAYRSVLDREQKEWTERNYEKTKLVEKAEHKARTQVREARDSGDERVDAEQARVRAATRDTEGWQKRAEKAQGREALYRQLLIERTGGFPTLVAMLEELDERQDEEVSFWLNYKSTPAPRAAEVVRDHAKRRRTAERERRVVQSIIEYYESIAPFLIDLRDEEFGDGLDEISVDRTPFTPEEREDPLTHFLTIDEYRNLSPAEKSQLALDRFWGRRKSRRLIGKLYERYVGYLYEEDGYEVEYVGIIHGFEDLGRDLICRKGNEVVVIQCKNWSQFKTIYEKHIFQFFGTVFEYRDKNPGKDVRAVFYTTTTLSDLARRFSNELDIELVEDHEFDQAYPSIKCNVSRSSREKIYHLPFDQQYDKVKIEPGRGEFYLKTVAEAEEAGFRRAFRYQGLKGDTG